MRRKNPDFKSYGNRETCSNPWNKNCGNRDITVFIEYKNERKSICSSCWRKIANNKYEWG